MSWVVLFKASKFQTSNSAKNLSYQVCKFSNTTINSGNHNLIKYLPYHQSRIYSVIVDVKAYPEFIPYCLSTRLIKQKFAIDNDLKFDQLEELQKINKIKEFDVITKVGYKGFVTDYSSHVICDPFHCIKVIAKPSSTFSSLTATWKLSNQSSSTTITTTTKVELDLEFKFSNPIHEFLLTDQSIWNKISTMMIKAFEDRLSNQNEALI